MVEPAARYRCPTCRDRGWIVSRAEPNGESNGSARRCSCAAEHRADRLSQEAGIPDRYAECSLTNFHVPTGSGAESLELARARATCEAYVDSFLRTDGTFCESGLLFVGRAGAGKTHLAVACLQEIIRRYGRVGRFVDFTTLVHRMQVSFDPTSEESRRRILDPLGEVDVLVLDELGAQKPTPFVRDLLYLVINTRYARRLPTLFTTNFALTRAPSSENLNLDRGRDAPDDEARRAEVTLQQRIGEPLLSRLFEMARPVELEHVQDFRREIGMHRLRT